MQAGSKINLQQQPTENQSAGNKCPSHPYFRLSPKPFRLPNSNFRLSPKPIRLPSKPIRLSPKPIHPSPNPIRLSPKPIRLSPNPIRLSSKPIRQAPKPIRLPNSFLRLFPTYNLPLKTYHSPLSRFPFSHIFYNSVTIQSPSFYV